MTQKRVLVAQGPSQLISALAIWEFLRLESGASNDILVLGGFCVPSAIARELERTCREIARTWDFSTVISTRTWERIWESGKMSFDDFIKCLSSAIGGLVSDVYVCRNMQPLNEAALYAWPDAQKICYTDLGMVDVDGAAWSKPMKETGYPPIDHIITHAPVERTPGAFDRYPLTRIPLEFFTKAWNKASRAVLGMEALSRELSKTCGRRKILLCPTNFTEGGNVHTVEEELRFHEACLAPYLEEGCTIFVKGHPRETMSQATRLTARLSSKGHDARCFPGYNTVPVDLFARCLKVDLLMSLFSYAGVVWRLVQPETSILLGTSADLMNKFIRPEAQALYHYDEMTALYYLLSIMATRREYRPVRLQSVRQSLSLVPARPILLPGTTSDAEELEPAAAKFYEAVLQAERKVLPK